MAEFGSLKIGDVCKVVGNSNGHDYEINEELRLYSIWDDNLKNKDTAERGTGFLAERLDNSRSFGNILREIDLEKVDTMEKMKKFTKSDLQEFDEVVYRYGNKSIYYQGDFMGHHARSINCYKENLLRDDSYTEVDIMQVIRNKEVIWERVEKSPLQIELESLEQQQREIADKIAELSKKV